MNKENITIEITPEEGNDLVVALTHMIMQCEESRYVDGHTHPDFESFGFEGSSVKVEDNLRCVLQKMMVHADHPQEV